MKFDKKTFLKFNIVTDVSFILVILVIWLDELLDLPFLMHLGGRSPVNITEAAFESILILAVWLIHSIIRRKILERLIMLEGILPICSVCKKIKSENSNWQAVEEYVSNRSAAVFSHGICPDCQKKLYPEKSDENRNKEQ